jgi:hypothetical protein
LNVYLDSSVLLRVILGEPEPLASWPRIDVVVSSELIRVERYLLGITLAGT